MSNWKDALTVGKQQLPPRICLYGPHGIGKSTLASQFPKPIFISTEDGLASLDVTSFPKATVVDDVSKAIKTLIKEEHDFKTLVVDSVDWLVEPLIVADIEANNDEKALSFGKGQVMVAESFRELLQGMDVLRKKRDMNIVLIAHSAIVRFEDPRTEPYDRYQPKLPNRCNALLQEWVDLLAFVNYKVLIKKSDVGFNNTKSRGISTGERLLHFVENPAFLAKNRYTLPDEMEMSYVELKKLVPITE
jgi:hypothetical protein